ncbi:(4Fe-4S)-binding protein [Methanoculleus sp. FWC-SCC1]|uniref:(4Fe-4S)-binding protein n=1 Tax=Methanoculleus frigidifontis TaxID=2584085 RepID=A0ABT8M5Y6_9EURY|nr:ATP-binding protein [Methanoculleus sp. FWC-SCC1]MDN7023353.1 (4Fe-4S)-binding protein [Methanoculleus sp. FWC-SCC1]
MIRLAVISGKGGTGKTMVTAALADVSPAAQVLADCDVDASNLELLFEPRRISTEPFMGLEVAGIDPDRCRDCGICADRCRFGAIVRRDDAWQVDAIHCEGCGVCAYVCPMGAITMGPRVCGEIYTSETDRGCLAHARLNPGAGNSGLLVHEVKKRANSMADGCTLQLIDGPPGIGCPLISTVSGMDAVLIVTEPSVSALHDLGRLVTVCRRFDVDIFVAINRFDLAEKVTEEIQTYCEKENLTVVGMIPFDPQVVEAVRHNRPVTRTDSPAAVAVRDLWETLSRELGME